MKFLKWISIFLIGTISLWVLILSLYYMTFITPQGPFSSLSYKTIATPYATFIVQDFSKKDEELITKEMSNFAREYEMDFTDKSFYSVAPYELRLKTDKVRVKAYRANLRDDFLRVVLYREKDWSNMSIEQHKTFLNTLIKKLRVIGFEVSYIEFMPEKLNNKGK